MEALQSGAADEFVAKLCDHLREDYSDSIVRLPDEESTVADLPDAKLDELVRVGIGRARHHGLTFESSISAFTAVMFETAPNFDKHNLTKLCLEDKDVKPNDRLDEILNVLTDKHWDKIRESYDVNAWAPVEELPEEAGEEEAADATPADEYEGDPDLAETMLNTEEAEAPLAAKAAKAQSSDASLEKTIPSEPAANMPTTPKRKDGPSPAPTTTDELDFDDTVIYPDPTED